MKEVFNVRNLQLRRIRCKQLFVSINNDYFRVQENITRFEDLENFLRQILY